MVNKTDIEKNTQSWDKKLLDLATHISSWSKDPSTKVGAVISDRKHRIIGVGYNGFPRGISDNKSDYNNRELKYMKVVHAEVNAILNSNSSVEGCVIHTTHFPCSNCASLIIQSGIKEVISYMPDKEFYERYKQVFDVSEDMFKEAQVPVWLYSDSGLFPGFKGD